MFERTGRPAVLDRILQFLCFHLAVEGGSFQPLIVACAIHTTPDIELDGGPVVKRFAELVELAMSGRRERY